MTGTRPRAFAAYCPYKIVREILLRKDTSLDVSDRNAGGLSAGHPNQLKTVSSRDKMPSPNQVSLSPSRSSSGIRVPDAAIPRPRPRKIIPLTNPRLAAGICGRIDVGTRTIITPPENPDANLQTKNHTTDSGKAQAKNAAVATNISSRSAWRLDSAAAISRARRAPARYPAKFAAPRETALAGENQCAWISGGISGVYANLARPMETRLPHMPATVANQAARLSRTIARA